MLNVNFELFSFIVFLKSYYFLRKAKGIRSLSGNTEQQHHPNRSVSLA